METKTLKERFKLQKRTPAQHVKRYLFLVILCATVAMTYHTFINGNAFAPGGIYGIASMGSNKLHIPMGVIVLIISIPIVIGAFWVLDLDTAIAITLMAVLTSSFEILMVETGFFQYLAEDKVTKIFAAIIGGALTGLSYAYSIQNYGTSDGTVAISAIVKQRHPHFNIAWLTFTLDAVVVAASFFVYWSDYTAGTAAGITNAKIVMAFEPIMYSLINMYAASKVCDVIIKGVGSAYKFEVVTDHPDEISKEIFEKLSRGVTRVPAMGMYTGKERSLLLCVIKRKQIGDFKRIIKSYPQTFAYLTTTNEITGYFSK